jgi:3-deoxy-7-phosphoheptulonate synthase
MPAVPEHRMSIAAPQANVAELGRLAAAVEEAAADIHPPALQQPDWPDDDELRRVCDRLAADVGPVDEWSCRVLRDELARAATGNGFAVIGGDCAERFFDATPARVIAKAEQLHRVADVIETATGMCTTRIGRFGGQFAKPRSQAYEELSNGRRVASYRGDAVNGIAVDERIHDPARLLTAHQCSSQAVRALLEWDLERRKAGRRRLGSAPRTYVGHEALLLDYERALLRRGRHASSAHFLWIGDRTRDPDHAHIAFASGIDNPVGVKVGPSVEPADLRALVARLDPAHEHRAGRLSLIVRMGAAVSESLLPPVIEALGSRARDVLWIVDPMHGNRRTNAHGQKTRLLIELEEEIRVVFAVLARYGLTPAGIHLEITPDNVTECVDDTADLTRPLPDYRSACDPRLNPDQATRIAEVVAELLRSSVLSRS